MFYRPPAPPPPPPWQKIAHTPMYIHVRQVQNAKFLLCIFF